MADRFSKPEIPDIPGWEDDAARAELDYQQRLAEQGRREELRMDENRWAGDIFGLDDGRPGIGLDLEDGFYFKLPGLERIGLWSLISTATVIVLVFTVLWSRGCLAGPQPAAPAPPAAGASVTP